MTKKKDKSQSIAGKWKLKSHLLSQTLAALTMSAAQPGPQRPHKSESKMAQEMALNIAADLNGVGDDKNKIKPKRQEIY